MALGSVFGQSYPYKFNYLTVDEGLSHTDACDIAQDKQGYIWVGTLFGLDRYDGYSLRQFYNDNEPLNNASKNRVQCICPDEAGNIWLGTEDGLQCFNAGSERYTDFYEAGKKATPPFGKLYKPAGRLIYGLIGGQVRLCVIHGDSLEEQSLTAPADVRFSDMAPDQTGLLYLSSNKGLWALDSGGHFRPVAITGLPSPKLSGFSFDNQHNLLLSTGDKMLLVDRKTLTVSAQFVGVNYGYIWDMLQDKASDYWVNVGAGLLRLDKDLHLIQFVNNKGSLHSLNSSSLTKIFIDRSQCLWVCTFGEGVNYCDLNEKLFYTLQHNPEVPNSLSGNHIRSVMEDGVDLWIGTTANGLNRYNLKSQTFTYYNTHDSPVRLKNDQIESLVFDNDRNLWIGEHTGIELLRPDRKTLWQPPGYGQFPKVDMDALVKDCFGNIWFGDHMDKFGVIWKDKAKGYHVKYYGDGEGFFILADKDLPQLFVSSPHGLKRLIIDDEGNILQTFSYTASVHSLSSNYTYPIGKLNDSTYWVGTIGGGLDRLTLGKDSSYTVKCYTSKDGVFNDVECLEIDNAGNIWMGGNGLECFHPATERVIRYNKNDGLQGNSFKVGSSYKGVDGRLYFGGINGLNYFYPDQIRANSVPAQPILTDILINNEHPRLGAPDSSGNMIPAAIGYCPGLTLSYLQNNFVVFFSSMHFANPLKCKYRYQLVGFDKDWKFTDGKNPSAAYSNLDYGRYTFVVEATNNDGVWSKSRAETVIVITPPWWKSDVAKFIYMLAVVSGLLGIYLYQARWYRLKRELEVRAVNEQKREELHQQQLIFFTNISHEFRTPLTLILGPLETLISQNKNALLEDSYQLMFRNAKRLINLVSELMNFKKVADSVIKLRVQPLIINQFCKDLAGEFQNLAEGKDISFKLTDRTLTGHTEDRVPADLTGLFDIQILEKILFNLLNNAFKYTPAGGQISFDLFFGMDRFKPSFENGLQLLYEGHRAKQNIYFRIADSGIGISSDSLTKIFDRYYRVGTTHLGSGVGLALVKSLTQLHKGDIYVYSERHKGTEIIIGIPWGDENYSPAEKATSETSLEPQLEGIDNAVLLPLPEREEEEHPQASKTRKRILLVDDNQELRAFLKQALGKHYPIYEAEDGHSAIEIATEKIPDLIISDVMMPGMNGIELCKIIKERFETSHIPFIILSAKDALDTKIEGMESGADYYFAKPLSIDLLLLTVHNIFEQGEKLKVRYTNNYLSEATELVRSEKDKAFFQELLTLIEDNIEDPGLDVDFLCERLFISRTKLYQKIQSISGQSVAEFIRTVRLKKAIQIMTHEDIAMNEVADRIGLQSGSNFSRVFKKEYGKSPLQFMQSLKGQGPGNDPGPL